MGNIGTKIKNLRKKKNMTQEKLGEMLLHKKSTISKWENSKLIPDIDTIKQISKIFDITIEELLGDTILEKTVKRKQQSENVIFQWEKVNYDGISDVKVNKKRNWAKIMLYICSTLVGIAGIILFVWFVIQVKDHNYQKSLYYIVIISITMMGTAIIIPGITFKIYYSKEDKQLRNLKHNVILKIFKTFIEMTNNISNKTKIVKSRDVKKMYSSSHNRLDNQITINVILTSGKKITIYEVDNSVFDKLNTVL